MVSHVAEALTAEKASRREWIALGVIALPCMLYSMDLTVLHLAVPKLSADLNPTSTQLLWIIDIYGFMVAGSLVTMGTLGDRIGRRRILLLGAAAFGVASILAAFSRTAQMLIVTRALLGVAGATIAPSTLSLIRNLFHDPHERTVAISIWITSFSLGGALGPLVGGVLLQFFWWGSVFLISLPIMVLLLVVGPKLLPEYRDPNAGRVDVTSAALSLVAVLSIIYGLKSIAQDGFGIVPLGAIVSGVAVGWLFARRQLQLDDPLIDLRLFKLPGFTASLATYGFAILVLFGGFLYLPQYLQLVLGLTPLESGLWTLPWALSFVIGSLVTPRLVKHFPAATLMFVGMIASAVGFAMFTVIDDSTSFAWFASGSFIFALGLAPAFTLTNDLIIGSAPPERAGAASAMSETGAEFGGAIGIAVFGTIGLAIYRAAVADALPLSAPAELAAAARSTLAGAIEVAAELRTDVGSELVSAARAGFLRGLRLCAAISAGGSLALALFVRSKLRADRG
jgi:MFS transporter, DHA2 family, multidrug resistance protein